MKLTPQSSRFTSFHSSFSPEIIVKSISSSSEDTRLSLSLSSCCNKGSLAHQHWKFPSNCPPTPSIYLLLTRLPLLPLFDFLTVFTKTIFHTDPSHSFFFPSLLPLDASAKKISRFRKTRHSSLSLFSRFFISFVHVEDK